jgi:hypothetical protein
MKKLFFVIAGTLIMIFNISAQENDSRSSLQFGGKIGLNYSNIYDTGNDQFIADPKIGLVAGGFLAIPIGRYLGFQPEILFSQKGFKASTEYLDQTYEIKRTTSYIDVPLLIAVKPLPGITFLAGPQYSYLMKLKDEFTGPPLSAEMEEVYKNENIRKNILCFLGGADFNISQLIIGTRIGWDIQNNNGDGTSVIPRYKNVWYQVTLGFRF